MLPDKTKSLHCMLSKWRKTQRGCNGENLCEVIVEDTIAEVEEIPTQELRSFGVHQRNGKFKYI